MKVRVLVPNLWTTKGKAYEGDVVEVPDAEGKTLCELRYAHKGKQLPKVEEVKAGAK
ncbi:hypothetical protein [Thalassospira sp.]|uniref:hypothetical protein n=1 Tax=Thalassospira sp. TaxID=1912094 RepID=UPI0025800DF2|nr:hypothetical protein [Thalassospira sp.]|tara:strand:- start:401 stop:571 length:171 start_codon:yes stop_codon:yes gene_type:complete